MPPSILAPRFRRLGLRTLAPLLLIVGTGAGTCGGGESPTDPEPTPDPVASVVVNPVGVELEIGGSRALAATVRTQGGVDVTGTTSVTWSSETTAVASVSGSGGSATVTGMASGSTRVRATAGGVSGTADVMVLPPLPVVTTATLPPGEVGLPYAATVEAGGGNGTFTWSVTAGALPPGLTLDAGTGGISGIPGADGAFGFTVEAASAGRRGSRALGIVVAPGEVEPVSVVVNVDFMNSVLPQFGDLLYTGDDGILSSTGGAFWNGADAFTSVVNALDEHGVPTVVDMIENVSGGIFVGAAVNELQDNGIVSGGLDDNGFTWEGLLEGEPYDLAFYVYHENRLDAFTRFRLTHDGGPTILATVNDPTWTLPGERNRDYLLAEQVRPVELSPGNWGFRVDQLNTEGGILALQLRGKVAPGG